MYAGADPEIGHGGGLNFGRFVLHKNHKLYIHKTPKTEQILHTNPKIHDIFEKVTKNRKKFSRAPCKKLQFCKFGPEAQENFAIFGVKYAHRAIQNGGRGADGGLAPP